MVGLSSGMPGCDRNVASPRLVWFWLRRRILFVQCWRPWQWLDLCGVVVEGSRCVQIQGVVLLSVGAIVDHGMGPPCVLVVLLWQSRSPWVSSVGRLVVVVVSCGCSLDCVVGVRRGMLVLCTSDQCERANWGPGGEPRSVEILDWVRPVVV